MAKTKKAAMEILTYAFIGIMVIFTIYPIIYTVLGSFKTNSELTLGGSFFPTAWHFENYVQAFIEADFVKYTFNSVAVSIAVMVIATLTASLAGFTFARREFAGKKIIMCAYVGLMFVALGSVTLYPI